ncbi:MAG: polyphosphate polymerase domain-containing protein [Lewinella sp.]|nr:polyphosphate polymerase domain-containing protein [Lewinella sp.]
MLRYEHKFFVPIYQLDKLRHYLLPFMEPDPFAVSHGGAYTVRSIYFDTPAMQCYFDKVAGIKRRNKVRLRGYNCDGETGTVFFEIKKKVDDPLFKNRFALPYREAKKVLSGAPLEHCLGPGKADGKSADNVRRFMYHVYARQMHPVVTVIYDREPFQPILDDGDNRLRITLDKHLRVAAYPSLDQLYEERDVRAVRPNFFIMEIKFNQYFPSWMKPVIQAFGLRKGPASKYAMSIETLGLGQARQYL